VLLLCSTDAGNGMIYKALILPVVASVHLLMISVDKKCANNPNIAEDCLS
jgi:hypothetical protein